VRVHRISEFLREARAEPSLLELCRAEQKSVKVIFRSKARQQGRTKSFCTRRNEEIAEAVVAVARFAEKYGVAKLVRRNAMETEVSLLLSFAPKLHNQ